MNLGADRVVIVGLTTLVRGEGHIGSPGARRFGGAAIPEHRGRAWRLARNVEVDNIGNFKFQGGKLLPCFLIRVFILDVDCNLGIPGTMHDRCDEICPRLCRRLSSFVGSL